jgi:mRNA-degrading endonuclease toxin of MazEF toxin-antitoxin module
VPRRGDDFATAGYVPDLGDVVHLNWAPAVGHEMRGPHSALVVSATAYNHGTGLAIVCPVTSKIGKLSAFELPLKVGRVNRVVILSNLRAIDYQTRSVQYENRADAALVAEANRRVRMIFP